MAFANTTGSVTFVRDVAVLAFAGIADSAKLAN